MLALASVVAQFAAAVVLEVAWRELALNLGLGVRHQGAAEDEADDATP